MEDKNMQKNNFLFITILIISSISVNAMKKTEEKKLFELEDFTVPEDKNKKINHKHCQPINEEEEDYIQKQIVNVIVNQMSENDFIKYVKKKY
jgi:hypothetical protein